VNEKSTTTEHKYTVAYCSVQSIKLTISDRFAFVLASAMFSLAHCAVTVQKVQDIRIQYYVADKSATLQIVAD